MKDLRDISLYLLDMDGTIYLGDRVFDCTLPFLSLLREQGKHYIFLTNNCTRNRYAYFDRLESMGIPSSRRRVHLRRGDDDLFEQAKSPARVSICSVRRLSRRSFAKRALS